MKNSFCEIEELFFDLISYRNSLLSLKFKTSSSKLVFIEDSTSYFLIMSIEKKMFILNYVFLYCGKCIPKQDFIWSVYSSVAYLELCKTSIVERFYKAVNGFKLLAIIAKTLHYRYLTGF